jgi:hypothetical protein
MGLALMGLALMGLALMGFALMGLALIRTHSLPKMRPSSAEATHPCSRYFSI